MDTQCNATRANTFMGFYMVYVSLVCPRGSSNNSLWSVSRFRCICLPVASSSGPCCLILDLKLSPGKPSSCFRPNDTQASCHCRRLSSLWLWYVFRLRTDQDISIKPRTSGIREQLRRASSIRFVPRRLLLYSIPLYLSLSPSLFLSSNFWNERNTVYVIGRCYSYIYRWAMCITSCDVSFRTTCLGFHLSWCFSSELDTPRLVTSIVLTSCRLYWLRPISPCFSSPRRIHIHREH